MMHPGLLATASTVDALTFAIAGLAVLTGGLGVVVSRNPVHSALMLVLTLFGVAVLFVAQDAQFLAAVQVIVYAGAIVVLFLFVIMLLGVDRKENLLADRLRGQRPIALALGLAGLVEVLLLAHVQWATGTHSLTQPLNGPKSNVAKLANSIFYQYLLPFEITGALLVIAVVGAVVLARRPSEETRPPEEAPDQDQGVKSSEGEP